MYTDHRAKAERKRCKAEIRLTVCDKYNDVRGG